MAGVSGLVGPHILPGPVIDCLIGRWPRRQHGNDSNDSKGKTASVCIPNSYTNRPASLSFSCPCLLIAQDTFARSCIFIFILHPSSSCSSWVTLTLFPVRPNAQNMSNNLVVFVDNMKSTFFPQSHGPGHHNRSRLLPVRVSAA